MGFARVMTEAEMVDRRLKDFERAADLGITPGMLSAIDRLDARIEDLHRKMDKLIAICTGQGYQP